MGTFHLYQDKRGEYRWRLRSRNSKIIADCGEGYKEKASCEHGIALLRAWDGEVEIYQDKGGGHRWRIRASNGEIFADSGEAYVSRSNVQRALKSVQKTAPDAKLVEDV
ncbi:MAG: DUF1508 domain-containing protein [Thermomicrobiales bacterium]|nr:DUF1508 domain-containing protein [Thermomicrobiales bacterium]